MYRRIFTTLICTLLVVMTFNMLPARAAGIDTNLKWSPGTGNQTFICSDTEVRVNETYDTATAVSDKMVDGTESFIFELTYNIKSFANSEAIVRNGWISQAVTVGGVRFYLNQFTNDGPYYGIQKYRVDMTSKEAQNSQINLRVIYDSNTKLISYEVNQRFIISVPFETAGVISLSSAWCAWSVRKAIYTPYPTGIPQELLPQGMTNMATPSPTQTPAPTDNIYTDAPTESTKQPTELDSGINKGTIVAIIGISALVIIGIITLLVYINRKKGRKS